MRYILSIDTRGLPVWVLLGIGLSQAAHAASDAEYLGLSSDGTAALRRHYDPGLGASVYTLTSTATGEAKPVVTQEGTPVNGASALSADGSTVIGSLQENGGYTAYVWNATDGLSALGTLGGRSSYARAVSEDGSVVVGEGSILDYTAHAYRWTAATGMVDLGTLGGLSSFGLAVSGDGTTVVGRSNRSDQTQAAFIWREGDVSLRDIDTLYAVR